MLDLESGWIYVMVEKQLQDDVWVVYELVLVDLIYVSLNSMRSSLWLTKRTLLLDVGRWRGVGQPDSLNMCLLRLSGYA